MKPTIENLRDTFKIGYEAFEASRLEADEVWNMYHNRQWTEDQLNVLATRGQPAETFNIIKLFARMLLGYYSTVINEAKALPVQEKDIYPALLINDIIKYTFRHNDFTAEGEKVKLSGIISGLFCSYTDVFATGERDQFGRPINNITLEHVPDFELVLDPMSKKDDYSDARFIHRFKWLSEDHIIELLGAGALAKLEEYYNFLDIPEAEFEYSYNGQFAGYYRLHNNYLIVHSIIHDGDKSWSVFWTDKYILRKKETTFKEVKSNYRVQKLHTSDIPEYYGIFREVKESQKAINQALIKLQLLVNTQRAFVETSAVENLHAFTDAFNRVTAVVPVEDLKGIKIEDQSKEVLDQYVIIDKAFDRIQRILSINDSFLGMAFASDSGRKVKLQQNATVIGLRYFTGRLESYYKHLSWDIANLAKQYYTASQALLIVDETVGNRWIQLNQPMQSWTGEFDQTGQPIMEYMYEEVLDPATNEPLEDDDGNIIIAPIPQEETEIAFTDFDIEMQTVAYNDEDEKNQLLLETILSGNVGQMLAQVNPAGFFKAASLSLKSYKTKYSPDIAMILEQTAMGLSGNPQAAQEASLMAQGNGGQGTPGSAQLKLPQNTNEGVG